MGSSASTTGRDQQAVKSSRAQQELTTQDMAESFAQALQGYSLVGSKKVLQLQNEFQAVFQGQGSPDDPACEGSRQFCLGYAATAVNFSAAKNRPLRFLQQCQSQAKNGTVAVSKQTGGVYMRVNKKNGNLVCAATITPIKAVFDWNETGGTVLLRTAKLGVNVQASSQVEVLVKGSLLNNDQRDMLFGEWLQQAAQQQQAPYSVSVAFSPKRSNQFPVVSLDSSKIAEYVLQWQQLSQQQQQQQLLDARAKLEQQLQDLQVTLQQEKEKFEQQEQEAQNQLAQAQQQGQQQLQRLQQQLQQTEQERRRVAGELQQARAAQPQQPAARAQQQAAGGGNNNNGAGGDNPNRRAALMQMIAARQGGNNAAADPVGGAGDDAVQQNADVNENDPIRLQFLRLIQMRVPIRAAINRIIQDGNLEHLCNNHANLLQQYPDLMQECRRRDFGGQVDPEVAAQQAAERLKQRAFG
ncbi:MAG: hypothetical protein AAF310_06485, partial [Myxococcota bacterium]